MVNPEKPRSSVGFLHSTTSNALTLDERLSRQSGESPKQKIRALSSETENFTALNDAKLGNIEDSVLRPIHEQCSDEEVQEDEMNVHDPPDKGWRVLENSVLPVESPVRSNHDPKKDCTEMTKKINKKSVESSAVNEDVPVLAGIATLITARVRRVQSRNFGGSRPIRKATTIDTTGTNPNSTGTALPRNKEFSQTQETNQEKKDGVRILKNPKKVNYGHTKSPKTINNITNINLSFNNMGNRINIGNNNGPDSQNNIGSMDIELGSNPNSRNDGVNISVKNNWGCDNGVSVSVSSKGQTSHR
jgi:hypothetical protein